MDRRQISHDILNILERLRIMHDLAQAEDYSDISKEEIKEDLEKTLHELKSAFHNLIQ